jgi:hypothetical protein
MSRVARSSHLVRPIQIASGGIPEQKQLRRWISSPNSAAAKPACVVPRLHMSVTTR